MMKQILYLLFVLFVGVSCGRSKTAPTENKAIKTDFCVVKKAKDPAHDSLLNLAYRLFNNGEAHITPEFDSIYRPLESLTCSRYPKFDSVKGEWAWGDIVDPVFDSILELVEKTDEPLKIVIDDPKTLVPTNDRSYRYTIANIIYNQVIDGYKLKITCFPQHIFEGCAQGGFAMMEFYNVQTGARFSVPNQSFRPSDESFWSKFSDDKWTMSYGATIYSNSKDACFEFKDVDFDGIKELLIENRGAVQRGCSSYDVYKVKGSNITLLTYPPFDRFDDLCELDHKNKIIRVHGAGGAKIWLDEYFQRRPNGKFELIKTKELDWPYLYIKEKK